MPTHGSAVTIVVASMLRVIRVGEKAQHAIAAVQIVVDVEAGLAQQREIAAERSQRHAEAAVIVGEADLLAARESRGEPDEAYDSEGNAFTTGVRRPRNMARPGSRRGCVESSDCHSVDNSHRVTDSVGVPALAESLYFCAHRACHHYSTAKCREQVFARDRCSSLLRRY